MLPAYLPIDLTMQDHFHMGLIPRDGSQPQGFGSHGEPPYKFKHITKRTPILEAQAEFTRAWDGTPFDHILQAPTGTPIIFRDIMYELRVTDDEFEVMWRLYKQPVYLVDILHCPPSQDHTPYVRKMYFDTFQHEEQLDPMGKYHNCVITLKDFDTVGAL